MNAKHKYSLQTIFDKKVYEDYRDFVFRRLNDIELAREPLLGIFAIPVFIILHSIGITNISSHMYIWMPFLYVGIYIAAEHIIVKTVKARLNKTIAHNGIEEGCRAVIDFFAYDMTVSLYSSYDETVFEHKAEYGSIKKVHKYKKYLFIELNRQEYAQGFILPVKESEIDSELADFLVNAKKYLRLY